MSGIFAAWDTSAYAHSSAPQEHRWRNRVKVANRMENSDAESGRVDRRYSGADRTPRCRRLFQVGVLTHRAPLNQAVSGSERDQPPGCLPMGGSKI